MEVKVGSKSKDLLYPVRWCCPLAQHLGREETVSKAKTWSTLHQAKATPRSSTAWDRLLCQLRRMPTMEPCMCHPLLHLAGRLQELTAWPWDAIGAGRQAHGVRHSTQTANATFPVGRHPYPSGENTNTNVLRDRWHR